MPSILMGLLLFRSVERLFTTTKRSWHGFALLEVGEPRVPVCL